jgi:PII-like signaling protein
MDRNAARINVFLSEDDRIGHHDLHKVVLDRAREAGLAGGTVWRGIEGFGRSGIVRTARFPDATLGLPLMIELIDSPEKIDAFLPTLTDLAPSSLVTRSSVRLPAARPEGIGPPRAESEEERR